MSAMTFAAAASALAALAAGGAALAQDAEIMVAELGEVRPLEVSAGGSLPEQVWSSGDAGALRAVLEALPASDGPGWTDRAAADLALSALLSGGDPPEGPSSDEAAASELRADRVLAAGGARAAYGLLSRTPRVNESETLSRLYAETGFALGERQSACRASNALLEERDSPYWLRVRAACLAFDGMIPAAELTAELARNTRANENFDRLFDALVLGDPLPRRAAPETGLELAIAEAVAPEARITPAPSAPDWLKRAAERTGPSISLPPTLPEALEAAVALDGADRRAALGALIQQDLDREIAAEALAIRLTDAAEQDRFADAAKAYGPEVARLPITGDTLAHGRLFVLAALGADDVIAARAWREALMQGPPAPRRTQSEFGAPSPQTPSNLAPPPAYQAQSALAEPPWTPPSPRVMVALDFAAAVADGRIDGDSFAALLAARIETADADRLCQAAALAALGADDGGAVREAMTGLEREDGAASVLVGPGLLAAAAGALGESQLHAAAILESAPGDAEACATAAAILDHAGLRGEALAWILELIVEEAA
jgi:hypothetical protein